MTDTLLTLPQVAKCLNVSVPTLRSWYRRGWLNIVRLPMGTVRVHPREVERILLAGTKEVEG